MILKVIDVAAGYGKIEVLHGVSINVKRNSVTAIIGPNGSGKSTLLKTIYGLIKPTRGTIIFNDRDITGITTHLLIRSGMGYLAQRPSVFPYLNVEENLRMGAWIFRHERDRYREALQEVFERFPILREKRNLKAGALSGGERRMLELGRALMTQPELLLIDEFSVGLSPKIVKEINQVLYELKKEGKITILAVDQNVRQLLSISDYVYVLKLGRKILEGQKEDILRQLDEVMSNWLR